MTEQLHYSSATINRDLNYLQSRQLVKRSYGGVELMDHQDHTPLPFRYYKMRVSKNRIAQKAAEFIHDGDMIFIDGTTTAQYIAQYITGCKNLTMITNNVALVSHLSKYGIRVICLGGPVFEAPHILYGAETIENAERYAVDKMFISAKCMSVDGRVEVAFYHLYRAVKRNAKQTYLLLDRENIVEEQKEGHVFLRNVDFLISDYAFDNDIIAAHPDTEFLQVNSSS